MSPASVVLVSPPVVKACEPLLGIATLKAFLEAHGVSCACIDANAEAQDWLLDVERIDAGIGALERYPEHRKLAGTWRSLRRKLPKLKQDLRSPRAYRGWDAYRTTVTSLNRAAAIASTLHDLDEGSPAAASLTDYHDDRYCDMASASVRKAAEEPQRNLFHAYFAAELIPRIQALRPSVVGISLIFRNQLLCGMVLAGMLRRALPGVHVTIGGELISAWVDHIEQTELLDVADSIIPYEGELGLLALARGLPLAEVPNLVYRDGAGALRRNPTRKVATLGEIPAPDFSWAPWELYFAPERTAPMVTARGCYWNRCTFCPEVVNTEAKLRIAKVSELTAQLDAVHRATGVTTFHFIDSAMPSRSLKGVAEHVIANQLPYRWYGFSRLEPYLFREGFAERLALGGCRMLKLGLETGSQRLLDVMDKKQDVDKVSRVLRSLGAAGIMVHAYLMFGTPFEELADAEATRRFVADHADSIQFMNCSLMNLARGSPMALDPPAHGIQRVLPFEVDGQVLDLALYDNFDGAGWGRLEARRYLHRVFLRDPAVRPGHLRTPPHFDANHSIFLHSLVFGPAASGTEMG